MSTLNNRDSVIEEAAGHGRRRKVEEVLDAMLQNLDFNLWEKILVGGTSLSDLLFRKITLRRMGSGM